jgi:hypothetical protein
MILFYNNQTGQIFATLSGRVHDEKQLNMHVDNGIGVGNIGKYIIGWIKDINGQKIEYNMDKFDLLQRFEDTTPESPLDYKIDINTGELIKIDK